MFMHIIVEKDVCYGIEMMKYVVNHYENFENAYVGFLFGFLSFVIALHIEINAIIAF